MNIHSLSTPQNPDLLAPILYECFVTLVCQIGARIQTNDSWSLSKLQVECSKVLITSIEAIRMCSMNLSTVSVSTLSIKCWEVIIWLFKHKHINAMHLYIVWQSHFEGNLICRRRVKSLEIDSWTDWFQFWPNSMIEPASNLIASVLLTVIDRCTRYG